MYLSFNVMYLGLRCGDIEVGYYSTSVKLYTIFMSIFTAFTGVMLPRMSYLVSQGDIEAYKRHTNKSIDLLLLFCIPIILISEVYTPQIIRIIAGSNFEGAILPMRIIMPLMLVVGYEQIIIVQMLTPMRKDKAILMNSCFGAGISLVLNFTIVPILASVGSAVVWFCSEMAVLLSAQFFVTKFIGYQMPFVKIVKVILLSLPALIISIIMKFYIANDIASFIIGSLLICLFYFAIELFVTKNELLINMIKSVRRFSVNNNNI